MQTEKDYTVYEMLFLLLSSSVAIVVYEITKENVFVFNRILSDVPQAKSPCQTRKELPVTIIYTDIMKKTRWPPRCRLFVNLEDF